MLICYNCTGDIMNRNIKNVCFFGLIFLFADQIIKVFINDQMVLYQSNILIRNLLSITLVHNTGAALVYLVVVDYF